MSSMPNSIARVNRYEGNATVSTTPYRPDESTARKLERAQTSFLETIVGRRGGLRSLLSQVEAAAPTNATVLITGETGTSKTVIARALNKRSPGESRMRGKRNCASLPA